MRRTKEGYKRQVRLLAVIKNTRGFFPQGPWGTVATAPTPLFSFLHDVQLSSLYIFRRRAHSPCQWQVSRRRGARPRPYSHHSDLYYGGRRTYCQKPRRCAIPQPTSICSTDCRTPPHRKRAQLVPLGRSIYTIVYISVICVSRRSGPTAECPKTHTTPIRRCVHVSKKRRFGDGAWGRWKGGEKEEIQGKVA